MVELVLVIGRLIYSPGYRSLFVATPYTSDTGAGETSGVKLDLSVLLDIMVDWVRKVFM